jgi:CPA2 family monovalent cation:H+ antiporter-2
METTAVDISRTFIELGIIIIGLGLITRFANRVGLSAIPLYLLAGLAFGNGGLLPLKFSEQFVHTGAEIGAVLLLFMLGLEYSGDELREGLRSGLAAGIVDFFLNFLPGFAAGFALGWGLFAALLLGGVTYISSSGIIAKVWNELGQSGNPEVRTILSILVMEDLAMAVYLPLIAVLLLGKSTLEGLVSIGIALVTVFGVLVVAIRYGKTFSRMVSGQSNEVILFTTFGIVLLVAGIANQLQISSAVGAFLVGVALSGPIAKQAHQLISPLRDLFAALFFLFFGLQIDPGSLPPVLVSAIGLGLVTALTKLITGWWAARRKGIDSQGCLRAGLSLVPRGEFSILIAGLGVSAGLEPQLGPFSAAYVLFLAILGPLLMRAAEPLGRRILVPPFHNGDN